MTISLLASACGDANDPSLLADHEQSGDSCLNCGTTTTTPGSNVSFAQAPRLWAFPDSLMFYADIQSSEFLPQDTVVTNDTVHAALITNVFVVNQNGSPGGDATFFSVDEVAEDTELVSSGKLNVKVRFSGSTLQRTAWLVINTTHPSYPQLTVSLTGKYFLNSGQF